MDMNDGFRINDDGQLVQAVWPTYETEARVTYGPSDGIIRRIRNANRVPTRNAAGFTTGLFGR
jgi:hypothetical protein